VDDPLDEDISPELEEISPLLDDEEISPEELLEVH